MDNSLSYNLRQFIPQRKMPLGVTYMAKGWDSGGFFHHHNFSEIALILRGTGTHFFEDRSCPVKAGDVLIIHPNADHTYKRQELELINVLYDPQQMILPIMDGAVMPLFRKIFPDKQSDFSGQAEPVLSLNADELQNILQKVRNIEQELRSGSPGCNILSLALFIDMVVSLCRLDLRNEPLEDSPAVRMKEAAEYIKIHYQQPISIELLAKKSSMSRRSFFIHFKNVIGRTPLQYLIDIRMIRATELLLHTKMPIGDIAVKCGFADSNYFCRAFRAQNGIPPSQYRLEHCR